MEYGDLAAIRRLGGPDAQASAAWRQLGRPGIGPLDQQPGSVVELSGIDLAAVSFTLSVETNAGPIRLWSGGQSAERITDRLTAAGWRRVGDRLVVDQGSGAAPGGSEVLRGWLPQVMPAGADVLVGTSRADLSGIGRPSGPTLAEDARTVALAACLGDVVAARLGAPPLLTNEGLPRGTMERLLPHQPTGVAAGVRPSSDRNPTPRAVFCLSWPSEAALKEHATTALAALQRGQPKRVSRQHWRDFLRGATVDVVGGAERLVRIEADTPGNARLALDAYAAEDFPGQVRP